MGQDEQDQIVGRLFREAGEAKTRLSVIEAKLQNVKQGIKKLVDDLPTIKAIALDSRHGSVCDYVNLDAIRTLLQQREDAAGVVEEFNARVKGLGA